MQAVLLTISIVYTVAVFVLVYLARAWFARNCPLTITPLPPAGHSPPAELRRRSPPPHPVHAAHAIHSAASAAGDASTATEAHSTLIPPDADVYSSSSQSRPTVSFAQRGLLEVSV